MSALVGFYMACQTATFWAPGPKPNSNFQAWGQFWNSKGPGQELNTYVLIHFISEDIAWRGIGASQAQSRTPNIPIIRSSIPKHGQAMGRNLNPRSKAQGLGLNPQLESLVHDRRGLPNHEKGNEIQKKLKGKSREKTSKSIEKTSNSIEKTSKSIEKTSKSIEKTKKSVEKTKKSIEKTSKSVEKPMFLSTADHFCSTATHFSSTADHFCSTATHFCSTADHFRSTANRFYLTFYIDSACFTTDFY